MAYVSTSLGSCARGWYYEFYYTIQCDSVEGVSYQMRCNIIRSLHPRRSLCRPV